MFSITGEGAGPKAYADMLQEFTFQVKEESTTWWWTDHLGSVGAALCWQYRQETVSTSKQHSNRLEQTSSAQWDRELAQLQEHGFAIFGYHEALLQASDFAKPLGGVHTIAAGETCSCSPPSSSDGRVTGEDGGQANHLQLNEGGPSHAILGYIDTAERSNEPIFGPPPGLAEHVGFR